MTTILPTLKRLIKHYKTVERILAGGPGSGRYPKGSGGSKSEAVAIKHGFKSNGTAYFDHKDSARGTVKVKHNGFWMHYKPKAGVNPKQAILDGNYDHAEGSDHKSLDKHLSKKSSK